MTETYHVQLEQFEGPMERLLELIEARSLEVTTLSLAQVTEDFLRYLSALTEALTKHGGEEQAVNALRMLADFIVVASRLVLIKSKSLLPSLELTPDEAEDIKELEARLTLYRSLRPAIQALQQLDRARHPLMSRPYFLQFTATGGLPAFPMLPPQNVSLETLHEAVQKLAENWLSVSYERETIAAEIISLEQEMQSVIERVRTEVAMSFTKLSSNRPRAEVIVSFIAVLHLARDQMISLEQSSAFSDILINPRT